MSSLLMFQIECLFKRGAMQIAALVAIFETRYCTLTKDLGYSAHRGIRATPAMER